MSTPAEVTRPRILLIGGNGQVGWELARTLAPLGAVLVHDRRSLDLADVGAIRAAVEAAAPHVIVNAAAYTLVDRAEVESGLAHLINARAPGVLAQEARKRDAVLVHYSTDYVFDGSASAGYVETDRTSPLNAYGSSKRDGDDAVLEGGASYVFRVSWVYGLRGRNFLRTMRGLAAAGAPLRVVSDQYGAPTWSRMIAEASAAALSQVLLARRHALTPPPPGVYHMTAPDFTTWHGFATRIVGGPADDASGELAAPAPLVQAIRTEDYPTAAHRPRWSVLDSGKLLQTFGLQLPPWQEQLRLCMAGIGAESPA